MMLRSFLIMSRSGIVIFEKSWEKNADASQSKWGGLIRVVHELSTQEVGLPVQYIETTNGCISMSTEHNSGLISLVFHTNDCSRELGQLIATKFISSFYETYRGSVNFAKAITNKGQFNSFSSRIVDLIKCLQQATLEKLQLTSGITSAFLFFDEGTEHLTKGIIRDEISVVANFKAFLSATVQTMSLRADKPSFLSMEFGRSLVVMQQLSCFNGSMATLVCVYKKKVDKSVYLPHIQSAQQMFTQVFRLLSYYVT